MPDVVNAAEQKHISLGGRRVNFRILRSRSVRHLRVRVGPNGVDVLQPRARNDEEVGVFLRANERWIIAQLDRTERLRAIRRSARDANSTILFRGRPTPVCVVPAPSRGGQNKIEFSDGTLAIHKGATSRTALGRSLENWLRKEARAAIQAQLRLVLPRLKRVPGKVYVMSQRTKWGNCSAKGNLSFNWRLIMAPDSVLRYLVTHEAVHLAVPDHSQRFWLTVRSLCPESEQARQWLCERGKDLFLAFETRQSDGPVSSTTMHLSAAS